MYLEKAERMFKWDANPFTFTILPDLFVGYEKEASEMTAFIENGSKFSLLVGPTGSGKTTMMKHLIKGLQPRYKHIIYLPKPPKDPNDWVGIFSPYTKKGILSIFSRKEDSNIYNFTDSVNKKLGRRKLLLFVDEAHEASVESLEWLRAITDHVSNLSVVMAGLPSFEGIMKSDLESLLRRVNTRIELTNLTKSETRELIKRRIESVGGEDIRPFTSGSIDYIYRSTGGFPREILRTCSDMVQQAMEKNVSTIDSEFMKDSHSHQPERVRLEKIGTVPERQKRVLEVLAKGDMTPDEIVANMESLDEYKSRDNALRAVNNLLGRLMKDGLVERRKEGKRYRYSVSSKYQTMLVNR